MTREEMLTNVIRIFGFEHENTIRFARAVERFYNDEVLIRYYYYIINSDF